jgi:hypothetical protein
MIYEEICACKCTRLWQGLVRCTINKLYRGYETFEIETEIERNLFLAETAVETAGRQLV